jgi:hypothetical protein
MAGVEDKGFRAEGALFSAHPESGTTWRRMLNTLENRLRVLYAGPGTCTQPRPF